MICNAHISQSVTMTDIFSKSMPLSSIFSKSAGWVDIARVRNETITKIYERFSALIQLTSTVTQNQAANSFGKTSGQLAEVTADEISSKILPSTIVTSSPENLNENANHTDVFKVKATNGQKDVNVLNYTSKISANGSFQPETSSSQDQPLAVNWISTEKNQRTTFTIRNSSQTLDQRSNSLQFRNGRFRKHGTPFGIFEE